MAKQVMLFDSHSITFKTVCLEAANKKPLSIKPNIARTEISR